MSPAIAAGVIDEHPPEAAGAQGTAHLPEGSWRSP